MEIDLKEWFYYDETSAYHGYEKALELACQTRLDHLVQDTEYTDRHILNSEPLKEI